MNRRTFIGCLSAAALAPRGAFGSESFTETRLYCFKPSYCVEEPLYCVAQSHIRGFEPLECRTRFLAVQEGRPVFDTELECRIADGRLTWYNVQFLQKEVAPRFFESGYEGQPFFAHFGWGAKRRFCFDGYYYFRPITCDVRDRSISVRLSATDGKTYVIEAPSMKCKEVRA